MSDLTTIGLQWLNSNSIRKYPISEDATSKDVSGGYTLPEDFLVDFTVAVPDLESGAYRLQNFCVTEVHVFGGGVVVNIGYDNSDLSMASEAATNLLIATISVPVGASNESIQFAGVGDFKNTTGTITVGTTATILKTPGSFVFDKTGTSFVSTLLAPSFRGVNTIRIRNQGVLSEPITGNIILTAGTNARITTDGVSTITLNAIDGSGMVDTCNCNADNDSAVPITSINGAVGALSINGSGCVVPAASGSTISIDDTCAQPCCGSNELVQIVNDQNLLTQEVRSQLYLMQQLDARLIGLAGLGEAIQASGLVSF